MLFLYGLLTATGAIIAAQTLFNYTLNVQYILGAFKGLFYKGEASIKKDINKL